MSSSGIEPLSMLPQEVWSLVFSYLLTDDRKNVRLTCRCFYKACCTYQIQRKEEIVFRGNLNTHSAMQLLCENERKIWNIKLCKVHLLDDSLFPFFDKHGANIHSLILVDCILKSGILRDILGPCRNLLCFSVIFTKPIDYNLSDVLFAELEVLRKRGTSCSTVIDLTFELRNTELCSLTNKELLQFFAMFPNIKKLKVIIANDFEESNLDSSDATSDTEFSLSCIYHQLYEIRHQLEELSLHIWSAESDTDYCARATINDIATIELKNLKQLSTNYDITYMEPSPHVEFQHLTSLDCMVSKNVNAPISAQILLILKSAPKLHSLDVKVCRNSYFVFLICKECFVALVRSRLKSFNVWDSFSFSFNPNSPKAVRADFDLSSLDESLMPNYTLRHLKILTGDSTLMLSFSKYFLCLENMYVKSATEDILYNIFTYQTKLRSLALYHCERYPLSRTRPKGNPFEKRLLNLEISPLSGIVNLTHLYIVDNISLDLSRFMLSKFVFSKLKSLTIRMLDTYPIMNCDIEALWQIIQKSTQLEHLEISWRTVATFHQWLDLFESLPKLRHFCCTDSCPSLFADSEYRQLFDSRPSLRSVCHHSRKTFEGIRYVYDIIENTVIMYPQSGIYSNPFPDVFAT